MHRLQSAMEYLMTYGWAILVIAVVLGVLYSLGIFSPSNFAPKASPGSCQVFRPNGPGTGYDVNLEGTCSGELPEYVAQFIQGKNSWIEHTSSVLPNGTSNATIMAWINPEVLQGGGSYSGIARIDGESSIQGSGLLLSIQNGSGRPSMATWSNDYVPSTGPSVNYNSWNFIAVTVNNKIVTLYLNNLSETGTLAVPMSLKQNGAIKNFAIGSTDDPGRLFYGSIANVQIYNTSLTTNDITALYDEGIGGAPIDIQNLVGWWPLNGNANDYSGNNNDGVPTNVLFTGSWQSGYTAP